MSYNSKHYIAEPPGQSLYVLYLVPPTMHIRMSPTLKTEL